MNPAQTTTPGSARKPTWPYPQITKMSAHPSGQWAKKIKGRLYYFGRWDQPERALTLYQQEVEDLREGRRPRKFRRPMEGDETIAGATVKFVADAFLYDKGRDVDSGQLSPTTWNTYRWACRIMCDCLTRQRPVADLTPADFTDMQHILCRKLAPEGAAKAITVTRMMMTWAHGQELIDAVPRYGPKFKPPGRAKARRASRDPETDLYHPPQIKTLLRAASPPLKAFIYLAINCAFGQTDCASIPRKCLHLGSGKSGATSGVEAHHNYPRPKTGIDRTCVLWPETARAIRAALKAMPPATAGGDPSGAPAFVTTSGGRWVYPRVVRSSMGDLRAMSHIDQIGQMFTRLRPRNPETRRAAWPPFYALRHTHITVGDEVDDVHARHRIRGHALPSMSDVYVQRISLERIKKVTDYVRDWLLDGDAELP